MATDIYQACGYPTKFTDLPIKVFIACYLDYFCYFYYMLELNLFERAELIQESAILSISSFMALSSDTVLFLTKLSVVEHFV